MGKTILIAILVLTLGLVVAGCSPSSQGLQVGNQPPGFRLPNLEGRAVALSDFRGKPVLINFWASWCPPCRFEMPFIQEIYEEWSDKGLIILTINIGESLSTVKEFMANHGYSFPVLLDTSQKVAQDYDVRGIPTTFFIDKNGALKDIKIGAFSSKAEIEERLRKIIS